ncbi:unnamed protein product [Owenia fusiformis]|uniref:Cytochrome P450 n=1 Tax=Owenia fusiformis TaxID=6347 RepID=A0A8S4P011_OWEFU|nr:unnamed protein product [Owenia fusiformis]
MIIVGVLAALYIYLTWNFGYWSAQGIKGPTPFPIIGTFWPSLSKGMINGDTMLYERYKKDKVYGLFDGSTPNLAIADGDLLKTVLVKEFSSFQDRRKLPSVLGPTVSNMLTELTGEEWKKTRSIMSQTFTSGKIKRMIDSLNLYTKTLLEKMGERADADEMFEFKDLVGKCALDMVAAVGFGIDAQVQNNPESEFVPHTAEFFKFGVVRGTALLIAIVVPVLAPLIVKSGIGAIPDKTAAFFKNIMAQAMANRKADSNKHNDFLSLILKAQDAEDESKRLPDDVILANAIVFILAGYDTVSNTVSWAAYEMALHQDIQEKVYEEIMEVTGAEDDITYEMLPKMTYLESVIEESQRLFPGAPRIERQCTETITIEGITIPKDAIITIPVYGIHHDADIYPDPEKFIPERFSAEEKAKRNPYYFQPFGLGPRSCIAMRLAQTEVKLCLAKMIQKLRVLPCEKTEDPIPLVQTGQMHAKNGLYLKVQRR